MGEGWRAVKHFEKFYVVSNIGRVYSVRDKRIMIPCMYSGGHPRYLLFTKDWERRWFEAHILVWDKFGSKPRKGLEVHHTDCDKTNNSITNLELLSSKEHRILHNKIRRERR